MPKTLSGVMEEAQKHTIAEALYYTGDARLDKEEARKVERGPSKPLKGRPAKSIPNKGKNSVFERYNPLTTTP